MNAVAGSIIGAFADAARRSVCCTDGCSNSRGVYWPAYRNAHRHWLFVNLAIADELRAQGRISESRRFVQAARTCRANAINLPA